MKHVLFVAVLVAGCASGKGGNNGNGGSGGSGGGHGGAGGSGGGVGGNGDGGAPGGDMADVTPIPAPMTTRVGAAGSPSSLQTDGNQHAAYLLNAAKVTSGSYTLGTAGELHVTTADAKDVKLAAGVYRNDFLLAPNGKSIVWVNFSSSSTGAASLMWLDFTKSGATAQTVIAGGLPVTNLAASNPFGGATYQPNPLFPAFSPTGTYLLVPVSPSTGSTTPDLHVVDLVQGKDVYTRPNGAAVYQQLMLPDDTMIFQDTAGGTSTGSTPVQTLYWMKLPSGNATAITTHTSSFMPTADGKTLIILKTSGDVVAWDTTTRTGAGKTIGSGAAAFSLGWSGNGPVAYVGADKSLHVVGADGTKLLDVAAAAAGDVDGTPMLAPDGGDVYYWQNVEQQEKRGTLMRAQVMSGATPGKVADKVSTADLSITDDAIVFLQNVDDLGQLGDAAWAKRDGSGVTALGQKAAVGALRVVNPGPRTWFALHLTGGSVDTANTTLDGSMNVYGGLGFAGDGATMDVALDAKVQAGGYAFSDDGRDAAFIAGITFANGGYAGALSFIATRAPSMKIDGGLAGVTELGPIVSRSLFVSAPGAAMPGVYFVKF